MYHKIKTLCGIINVFDDQKRSFIGDILLGRLLEFPNKSGFFASFGQFLRSRQLEVANPNEIWEVYAGTPVRFLLREFKFVTRLPCGKYLAVQKKKRKGQLGSRFLITIPCLVSKKMLLLIKLLPCLKKGGN